MGILMGFFMGFFTGLAGCSLHRSEELADLRGVRRAADAGRFLPAPENQDHGLIIDVPGPPEVLIRVEIDLNGVETPEIGAFGKLMEGALLLHADRTPTGVDMHENRLRALQSRLELFLRVIGKAGRYGRHGREETGQRSQTAESHHCTAGERHGPFPAWGNTFHRPNFQPFACLSATIWSLRHLSCARMPRSPAHHDFVRMNAEPVRRRTFKKPLFQWYSMIPGTWVIRAGATGAAAPLHGPNCQARAAAREARE
ncbi:MAG: hypothetical protein O9306_09025 [Beijerinckiaceae bacterium]|nr:hypothetical protein [Beijerinckiaceae bacterium]